MAMNVIVTAGPTREYIDAVRFITNASSGRMGYACAAAAVEAGHRVTLVTGPVALAPPAGVELVRFVSVAELRSALEERFDDCDALIMAAAVGDFTVAGARNGKIPRSGGPIQITLLPTEDILASLAARRREEQVLIGFALEEPADVEKARGEMAAKGCDYVVLNRPAAMSAEASEACIISRGGIVLPWAARPKEELARHIVALLAGQRED